MFSTLPRSVRDLKISSGEVAFGRGPVRILSFDRAKSRSSGDTATPWLWGQVTAFTAPSAPTVRLPNDIYYDTLPSLGEALVNRETVPYPAMGPMPSRLRRSTDPPSSTSTP